MKHFVMNADYVEGYARVGTLENGPEGDIKEGASVLAQMRDDAYYQVEAEFAKNTKIADAVGSLSHFVVSARLKAAIEPLVAAAEVELLPVRLKDAKGQPIDGQFFIVNPLGSIDVIDAEASQAKFNPLVEGVILRVKRLVLKPTEAAMFRPAHMTRVILVREDLVEKLGAGGFVGLDFVEASRFKG